MKKLDIDAMPADSLKSVIRQLFSRHSAWEYLQCNCAGVSNVDEHDAFVWMYEYLRLNPIEVTVVNGYQIGSWKDA